MSVKETQESIYPHNNRFCSGWQQVKRDELDEADAIIENTYRRIEHKTNCEKGIENSHGLKLRRQIGGLEGSAM